MGFYSAPRLTQSDKRNLAQHHAPLGFNLVDLQTVDFNFIRAEYVNASRAEGEPMVIIVKWVHNKTVVLETLPGGGFHINAWDSVTTRKKLGLVLPAGLSMRVVDHTQYLVDTRGTQGDWDKAMWHRGDDFVVTADGITGGDAWFIGSKPIKRNAVTANPSFEQGAA